MNILKKYLYLFTMLVSSHKICCCATTVPSISLPEYGHSRFHCEGVPSQTLKNVFGHLGTSIETLEQANAFAQQHLIRRGERWHEQEDTPTRRLMRECTPLLMEDLQNLGMFDAPQPTRTSYTYVFWLGSLKNRVEERLAFMKTLEQQRYQFDTVVLLGGQRELKDDEKEVLPLGVNTEADMMKYIYQRYPKKSDQTLFIVDAPMIQKADGTLTRPTTDSTFVHFARTAPKPGACLLISNHPYVLRQTLVAQRILDQSKFPTEGFGKAIEKPDLEDIVMIMDEFARTLYEVFTAYNACVKK